MKRLITCLVVLGGMLSQQAGAMAPDLARICYGLYPGCTLYAYDFWYNPFDYSALWCGDELIYEQSGFGGKIGSGSNCVYFT